MADKTSSASDRAYWLRIKNQGGASKRKLLNRKASGVNFPDYGRKPREGKKAERVVFSSPVKAQQDIPLHRVTCDGVLLELSPRMSDAVDTISKIVSGLAYSHVVVNPLTGKISLVSSRGFGG